MTKRSLYLGAALAAAMLLACATRAAEPPLPPSPVKIYAAVGCDGAYVAWVIFSNGKVVRIDEDSGMTRKQFAEVMVGIPAEVRRFDQVCPIHA